MAHRCPWRPPDSWQECGNRDIPGAYHEDFAPDVVYVARKWRFLFVVRKRFVIMVQSAGRGAANRIKTVIIPRRRGPGTPRRMGAGAHGRRSAWAQERIVPRRGPTDR